MVLDVNKQKMIKKLVGQFAQATGEVKAKDGDGQTAGVKPQRPRPFRRATPPAS